MTRCEACDGKLYSSTGDGNDLGLCWSCESKRRAKEWCDSHPTLRSRLDAIRELSCVGPTIASVIRRHFEDLCGDEPPRVTELIGRIEKIEAWIGDVDPGLIRGESPR